MNNYFTTLFFAILIAHVSSIDVEAQIQLDNQKVETVQTIIQNFEKQGDLKALFKVWHMVFKADYDINTEHGINRYKIFKNNYKYIQNHNSKNLEWKAGINHLTDKTPEEIAQFYNVHEMKPEEIRSNLRRLINLDDYDDSQDDRPDPIPPHPPVKVAVDWSANCGAVRDQLSCGSCWAFSTAGAVETNYYIAKKSLGVAKEILSTQQLVDCDYFPNNGGNWGCNGGWMKHATSYYQSKGTMREADYPYKGVLQTCAFNSVKLSPVKVGGFEYPLSSQHDLYVWDVLSRGTVSQCVEVTNDYYYYASGLYNPTCTGICHHAIVLVGWGTDATKGTFWKGRNSWGPYWGEKGYFRVKDRGALNGQSCMMANGLYSCRPKIL